MTPFHQYPPQCSANDHSSFLAEKLEKEETGAWDPGSQRQESKPLARIEQSSPGPGVGFSPSGVCVGLDPAWDSVL